jgi:outer membrane protein OmpA-like peptidoglycan-associated protein
MACQSMRSITLAVGAIVCAARADARAERWFVAEVPAAVPVSEPQSTTFRTGVMPAFGIYSDNGPLAFGLRMRVGVLRSGSTPSDHRVDPGMGGLGTLGLALRYGVRDGWIEAVAGGGYTGDDLVPAIEAGVGWDFPAGAFDIGPSARYMRVISRGEMATLGSASLLLIGVDIRFGKHPARPAPIARVAAPLALPPPPPEPLVLDRDPDRIVDLEASCESDAKGCEIAEHIFLKNDRIVLEERVLFEVDRAGLKPVGRSMVGDIARVWGTHPEWRKLTIEGHADVRGSDAYNLELSRHRADSVRAVFLELGVDPARIEAVGYGRSRPRDPGNTEAAYQLNRRVEFAIEREIKVPTVGASR